MRNNRIKFTDIKGLQGFLVMCFIFIALIFLFFPFSIFIIFFAHKSILEFLNKEWKKTGIDDFLRKNYWTNYEKIITEIKKSKKYQTRVKRNRQTRNQVEDLFTDNQWKQIDGEDMTISAEEKFKKMQRELEDKKNKEKIFYQQNKQTLQDKFAQQSKIKKAIKKDTPSWRDAVSKNDKKSHKNFFWNNKKASSFGEGKSIWDNYESVTERFSSNKK